MTDRFFLLLLKFDSELQDIVSKVQEVQKYNTEHKRDINIRLYHKQMSVLKTGNLASHIYYLLYTINKCKLFNVTLRINIINFYVYLTTCYKIKPNYFIYLLGFI